MSNTPFGRSSTPRPSSANEPFGATSGSAAGNQQTTGSRSSQFTRTQSSSTHAASSLGFSETNTRSGSTNQTQSTYVTSEESLESEGTMGGSGGIPDDSETFSFVPWMKFQVVAIPQSPEVMAESQFLKGVIEEVKKKTTEEVIKEVEEQLRKEVQRMMETLKSTVTAKLDTISTIFTEQFKESIKSTRSTRTIPQPLSVYTESPPA